MACLSTCRPPSLFLSLSPLSRNPKIPQTPSSATFHQPRLLFSPRKPLIPKTSHSPFHYPTSNNNDNDSNNNNNNNDNNNNGSGGNNSFWGSWWWHDNPKNKTPLLLLFLISRSVFIRGNATKKWAFFVIVSGVSYICCLHFPCNVFAYESKREEEEEEGVGVVYEVRGGKWTKLVPDPNNNDVFVVASSLGSGGFFGIGRGGGGVSVDKLWLEFKNVCMSLMLPDGFPNSVTSDYFEYSLWRGVQGVASQISGVLATQALLYAVGLGKGAIPTAAAVNWVLKDGIGYISKIFLSKFGRHFDVHPKGWRLFADLLENAAFGMEMLTPAFPHLFVFIGAVAGAGRSAAALIQAATRSCFYAGFAAQRNFAEVIAKGEAQGMVSKSIGIVLGIAIANRIGSSTPLALACFTVVTWVHMFCNLKSYRSIQLRTLNPYRGSLVFSEYLLSGQAPPVKEVNDEEPLFPGIPFLNEKTVKNKHLELLSSGAKDAAAEIEQRLQLGSRLSDVISNKEDAIALFDLYRNEGYILTEHHGQYHVALKENSSQLDMLKSLFHVSYLYWLERNAGIMAMSAAIDCRPGGRLRISLDYVRREFKHAKGDAESMGWVTDGLIARPLPNRIRPVPVPT